MIYSARSTVSYFNMKIVLFWPILQKGTDMCENRDQYQPWGSVEWINIKEIEDYLASSEGLLSGWYFLALLKYASLTLSLSADLFNPSTA